MSTRKTMLFLLSLILICVTLVTQQGGNIAYSDSSPENNWYWIIPPQEVPLEKFEEYLLSQGVPPERAQSLTQLGYDLEEVRENHGTEKDLLQVIEDFNTQGESSSFGWTQHTVWINQTCVNGPRANFTVDGPHMFETAFYATPGGGGSYTYSQGFCNGATCNVSQSIPDPSSAWDAHYAGGLNVRGHSAGCY